MRHRLATLGKLAALFCPLWFAAPADATPAATLAGHPCGAAIEKALAGRGIAVGGLADLFIIASTSGGRESTRLEGYDAWLQRPGQPGSIVVRVDTRCTLREIYARDGARLDR